MNIKSFKLKSNGWFSIVKEPYDKKQHLNQQQGLDKYVDVLNHYTGNINSVKLYENKTGLHFKADGGTHYLSDFVGEVVYVPFQILGNEKIDNAPKPMQNSDLPYWMNEDDPF